jgi:hypothetical protein
MIDPLTESLKETTRRHHEISDGLDLTLGGVLPNALDKIAGELEQAAEKPVEVRAIAKRLRPPREYRLL